MNVTKKCIISGKQGFDTETNNRFAIIEVLAKNGDTIKVNKINGIKYAELFAAFESPKHEEHPIVDDAGKTIVVGGEENESKRTICVIGK